MLPWGAVVALDIACLNERLTMAPQNPLAVEDQEWCRLGGLRCENDLLSFGSTG